MKKWLVRFYLLFILVENGVTSWKLSERIKQGSDLNPVFPLVNQVFLVFLILLSIGIVILLFLEFKKNSVSHSIHKIIEDKYWFWGLLSLFILIPIETGQDILFLRADLPADYYPRFLAEGILILYWASLFSFQSFLLLVFEKFQESPGKIFRVKKPEWLWLAILAVLFFMLVLFTGSGYIPHSSKIANMVGNFTEPNAPLTMIQVIIVWLVITLIWLGLRYINIRWHLFQEGFPFDIFALLSLWGIAFLIWSNVPLESNYFVEAPRAPNYQFNVLSDSIFYDVQAQRYLAGEGFSDEVQHPLYGFILSIFHILGGDHFQDIYLLQVALLAFTPYILYKLASLLYDRYAGWLIAGFYIVREFNALVLGDTITLSTVNILMTETVTLMGVILVIYTLIAWLQAPDERKGLLILIGCQIGILALLRVELLSFAIVTILLAVIIYWKKWQVSIKKSLILVSAILLIIVPWMTRNWQRTGNFYLDKSQFFQRTVQVYMANIFQTDDPIPEQTDVPDLYGEEPNLNVISKVYLHAKNSLVESFLYLPINHQPLGGLDNFFKLMPEKGSLLIEEGGVFSESYLTTYVKILPYWWRDWNGYIAERSIIPSLFVLTLCFTGFWFVWKKNRLIALTPFLFLVVHIFSYALFSRSGGRFIRVVDWITLLYFGLGISGITVWSVQYFYPSNKKVNEAIHHAMPVSPNQEPCNRSSQQWAITAGISICIIVGISMPLIESLIQPRYTEELLNQQLTSLSSDEAPVQNFLDYDENSLTMIYGKALYPGFYEAGEKVLDDRKGRVPDSDQPRLVFYLVGMENIWVSIPLDFAPSYFPHGVNVILLGNLTRNSVTDLSEGYQPYFLAEKVVIFEKGESGEIHMIEGKTSQLQ